MKNKNAFTLVELLATLVILGVLLAIAVPTVGRYLKQGKNTYYHGLETDTLAAGRDYLLDYKSLLPREIEGVTGHCYSNPAGYGQRGDVAQRTMQ